MNLSVGGRGEHHLLLNACSYRRGIIRDGMGSEGGGRHMILREEDIAADGSTVDVKCSTSDTGYAL